MFKTIQIIVMATLCLNFNSRAQSQKTLRLPEKQAILGKVISSTTGEALPGAAIKVTAPSHTTVSNDKGEFILTLSNGTYNISISHLSYKTKNISIQIPLKKQLVITLDTDDKNLEEVEINAGYYTVKEKERTGSISRVTAETIGKQPVSNPLASLIGRMPGVNIEQQSGVNGGGFKVEIRGVNSLRTDARQPLYLIDGVAFPAAPITNANFGIGGLSGIGSPLNFLSPADIESIEILKDADATAIYGSRGANGVVLIKTRTAKAGRTVANANVFVGISKISSLVDLLNTAQYLEMRNEAFKNDGTVPGPTDYDVNGTWDKNRYTDWQKELIGGTAQTTTAQLSIGGGNENTRFNIRSSYSKQGTVSPGDFKDKKASAAMTLNHTSSNKRLALNLSVTYAFEGNNLPTADLAKSIDLAPNAPDLYDENGKLNWELNSNGVATWTNPLSNSLNMPYSGKTNNFLSTAQVRYLLFKGLTIKSDFGLTNIRLKENKLTLLSAQAPSATATAFNQLSFNTIETWLIEPQIRYETAFLKGNLDVLIGSSFQEDNQANEGLNGTGYTNELLLYSISAAPNRTATSSNSMYRYNAIFGRINYNYNSKYLINLTGRRDGSSKFGPGRQFANFGAAGLAWVFSNENFFKTLTPILSFGKLRGSYGITGSDQIPNYGYLETYTASRAYQDETGLFPSRIANPDYSWETNRKLEFALDLGFLDDSFMVSTSVYRNRSSNQLVGYPLPDITGFPSVQYNLPATVQNTGFEFEINTSNLNHSNLIWKTSLNFTIPKNRLISYPNIEGSSYVNTYTVGESLYTPRVYKYLGVDPQTGLYSFSDLDGNGVFNNVDRVVAPKALTAHLYGGLQNSFAYKNFEIDFTFQYVNKTARDPMLQFVVPGLYGAFPNRPVKVMERWQNINDRTDIQKFTQSTSIGGVSARYTLLGNSDRFVDASFLRLKNLSFSWNMPKSLLNKVQIVAAKIYVQGQNLFTLTRYSGDPETTSLKALPTLRTVTAGIQLSL